MAEVCVLDWHVTPFRRDKFLDAWEPAAAKMPAYGAKSYSITRSIDDPLAIRHTSIWDDRADFERFWFSDEVQGVRAEVVDMHDLPILPTWHTLLVSE